MTASPVFEMCTLGDTEGLNALLGRQGGESLTLCLAQAEHLEAVADCPSPDLRILAKRCLPGRLVVRVAANPALLPQFAETGIDVSVPEEDDASLIPTSRMPCYVLGWAEAVNATHLDMRVRPALVLHEGEVTTHQLERFVLLGDNR